MSDEEGLQKRLQRYAKAETELHNLISRKREHVKQLKEQAEITCAQADNLSFRLESDRAQKMGSAWALTVFMCATLMFHAYANSSWLLTALNGLAFLWNWRSLYIVHNHLSTWAPTAFAWAVVAFTLKAV